MEKETLRGAFSEEILKKAKQDRNVVAVCTDSRGSASIGAFAEELPEQFIEMGIAEQNAVTVSAGMALAGKKVFTIGPASFYSMRSAEQIKVDVAYTRADVKIIGISGGLSYGALGATHHSLQDIALMRSIPGLVVEIPSDAVQMRALVDLFLEDQRPAYIRVGRGAVPVIYEEGRTFRIGKAETFGTGRDIAIFACGQMVYRAVQAAGMLAEKGIQARVYDMHTIKPLDLEAVREACLECGCILTVEEHSIYGGMGSAVAEEVIQTQAVPFSILGVPDEEVPNGSDSEVFCHYGMDAEGIAKAAEKLVSKKSV